MFRDLVTLANGLAWPIVALIGICAFRKEVKTFLAEAASVRVGTVQFDRQVANAIPVGESVIAEAAGVQDAISAEEPAARTFEISEDFAIGALINAWNRLEATAREIAPSLDLDTIGPSVVPRVAGVLEQRNRVPKATNELALRLVGIRNTAVHNFGGISLSPEAISTTVRMMDGLRMVLHNAQKNQQRSTQ